MAKTIFWENLGNWESRLHAKAYSPCSHTMQKLEGQDESKTWEQKTILPLRWQKREVYWLSTHMCTRMCTGTHTHTHFPLKMPSLIREKVT